MTLHDLKDTGVKNALSAARICKNGLRNYDGNYAQLRKPPDGASRPDECV